MAPNGVARGPPGISILSRLVTMGGGVGIDVGSRATRVVKLTRRRGAASWAGMVSANTGDDLRGGLKEAGISTGGGVAGLPGKATILRYSRLPFVPAWKLKMLVGYETTQGGEADVSFDFRLLNLPTQPGSNELTVLTAAAKNEMLTERLDRLAQLGVRGVDFTPDAVALHEVFSNCPESREALDEYCLVLDIGGSKTEMTIAYNGELVFARSLGFGGDDFTTKIAEALGVRKDQAERLKEKRGEIIDEDEIAARPSAEQPMLAALAQAATEFFGTINASIMFAKAQTKLVDMEIGRVYVSGAGARLDGLAELIGSRLDARVSVLRAPEEWGVPGEPGRPSEWMIAVGLALLSLEPPEDRMSILPPAERKRLRFWRHDILAYAACAVFVIAAATGTAAHIHNWMAAKATIGTRKTLAAEAKKRDEELDVLIQGNKLRRGHLELLGAAADSGAKLAEFIELVKQSQQGSIVLSEFVYDPGDINRADVRPVVTLVGSVGPSVKTHHEVLDNFCRQLTTSKQKIIEEVGKSADGSSLEFRLRIPLTEARAERRPK